MNNDHKNEHLTYEVDFQELFTILTVNKKFIAILTSLFAIVSLIFSLTLSNVYTATTLLRPATSDNSGSMGQYSGIASMAGITLSGEGNNELGVALAMVKSKKLISQLMTHESFLPNLMAAKSWRMKSNTIIYDSRLYDVTEKKWTRRVSPPFNQIPSSQEAIKEFSKLVSISQNTKNNLVTLNVSHISPIVAQEWSVWIIKEINLLLADMKVNESQASIDYLNSQIKVTPYAELRTMFYELIQEATQNMMLAKVNAEYALVTIDPPLIPQIKSKPARLLIFFLGAIFGLIVSIIIILFRHYRYNKKTNLSIDDLRKWLSPR